MFIRKYNPVFVIFFLILTTTALLLANTIIKGVNDTLPQANKAYTDFDAEKDDYISYWVELIGLEAERAALNVAYDSNTSEMERGAMDLAIDAIPTDFQIWGNVKSTAKNAAKLAITYSDDLSLKKALVQKTIAIQKKKAAVATQLTLVNSTYSHYVAHIGAFNNSNETPSDDVTPTKKGRIPDGGIGVDTDLSVPCSNPKCDTVYKASEYGLENIVSLSETNHLVDPCSYDHAYRHGGLGENSHSHDLTSPTYWRCPGNRSCPISQWHVLQCPGVCGEKNVMRYRNPDGSYIFHFYTPHEVDCKEKVPRGISNLYLFNECRGIYYSCAGVSTCPNAENHIDNDDQEANNPTTPTYHACGVHESWQSGDHSHGIPACGNDTHAGYACQIGNAHTKLIASCSVTNGNGDSCTVTSYYECQRHTHQYPALISGPCGHSYTSADAYNHRSETCPTNSSGQSCTYGSYYACSPHTHAY
ncbi:hypothetical protein J5I95_03790 [Candidatus Poribacteria bacterium]|nr:hypothetical protein [Candidatus Poribacteria bacterium]